MLVSIPLHQKFLIYAPQGGKPEGGSLGSKSLHCIGSGRLYSRWVICWGFASKVKIWWFIKKHELVLKDMNSQGKLAWWVQASCAPLRSWESHSSGQGGASSWSSVVIIGHCCPYHSEQSSRFFKLLSFFIILQSIVLGRGCACPSRPRFGDFSRGWFWFCMWFRSYPGNWFMINPFQIYL